MVPVLIVAVVIGSGITAGVLFAVALSVLPALLAMPAERYVYVHQLLGRHWDPTMPVIVLCSAAIDVVLAVIVASGWAAVCFAAAGALLLGVSAVSHLCNVPINRRVRSIDPDRIPAGWDDPRPLWCRWHLTRTTLAVLAIAVNAAATVMR